MAFSFDTTGSMYACLGEVRRELQETISRLKRDIPGIRLATIAHGDYCDASSSYVTKGGGLNGMNENYNLTCESHIFIFIRWQGGSGRLMRLIKRSVLSFPSTY